MAKKKKNKYKYSHGGQRPHPTDPPTKNRDWLIHTENARVDNTRVAPIGIDFENLTQEHIDALDAKAEQEYKQALYESIKTSEMDLHRYGFNIPDADASHLTFEAVFPYAKTLNLGMAPIRAYNAAKFTGTPGAMYRGIGTEGLRDVRKSGALRPKQNIPPIKVGAFDIAKDYNKIQKGVYATPSVEVAKRYGEGVIAEIPEGVAKWKRRYRGQNWSQKTQDLLPVDNINVFKQNFFGTYKPVKFNYGGDMKKIKKYPHGGPHTDPPIYNADLLNVSNLLPEVTVTDVAPRNNPELNFFNRMFPAGQYGNINEYAKFIGNIPETGETAASMSPVIGDAMDVGYTGDALSKGNYGDAALYGAGALFPFLSGKNFSQFMKYARDNYKDIAKIGDNLQDAYLKAKKSFDLGLYKVGRADLDGALGKAAKNKIDNLKSQMNQLDIAGDIISPNRYKLIPDIKSIKSRTRGGVLDEIDELKTSIYHQKHRMRDAKKAVTSTDMDATYRDFLIKGGDMARKKLKDLQMRASDIGGGLLKDEIEDIDRTLMRSLSPVNPKYKGLFDLVGVNPNKELNPLLGPRFKGDETFEDFILNPRLSAGESVILDMYKNPFKMNKYGGSNMKNNSMDVDYEAEGGEVVIGNISVNKAYNGGTAKQYKGSNMYMLEGPSHAEGGIGIKMNTPSDNSMNYMSMGGSDSASYVFTDRLKVGGMKGATYADIASKFGNELDNVTTMAMGGDKYDRTTAKLMKPRIMEDVKDLFDDQEEFKKENNIDQEPREAGLGAAFAASGLGTFLTGATGLPAGLAAAQFLPGLINIGKSVFGKTPELEYDKIIPETQEYQDFNPLIKSYMGQQDRSLAGLRKGLEGSGISGAGLRANLQAGLSGSQNNAANFLSQVGQMQTQSNRQTDQFNIGQQAAADQGNMQMEMAADQFAAQNDPSQAFGVGLSQILGTATSMSKEGFQRDLLSKFMGSGDNSEANMLQLLRQFI